MSELQQAEFLSRLPAPVASASIMGILFQFVANDEP